MISETSLIGLDIVYPVNPPHAFANIKYVEEERNLVYFVLEPTLAESEKKIIKNISEYQYGMIISTTQILKLHETHIFAI